jgi:hypothetical protein
MPDGPHNKVKLNVRVSPSKKEEWKEALEEGETLTSLVQRAVDHEIRHEYVLKDAIDEVVASPQQSEVDFSEVTDQVGELQQEINSLEGKIDTLSAANSSSRETTDVVELAMDVLPRIPSYPGDIPQHVHESLGGKGEMDDQEYIRFLVKSSRESSDFSIEGSAQRISNEMGEPAHIVREALIHLETSTTENVTSAVVDGTRHWMQL